MAIIYTYPTKTQPTDNDLILISDAEDQNKTKQITVSSLKSSTACVTSIIAGNNITIDPVNGVGDVTINASASSDLAIEDEGNAITGAATSINFKGGGVFAEVPDPNFPGKVDVEVLPRRNDGFSPYPIYQGDSAITIPGAAGNVRVYGCNAICDVQGGQMTVARIYGNLQELLKFSMAVYTGELSDAANTQLVAYGSTQIGAVTAGTKIHRLNLDTTNVWVPEAGTPIVVVFQFVNSINQANSSLVLGSSTSGDAGNVFETSLAFQMEQLVEAFDPDPTSPSYNTNAGSSVTDLVDYNVNAERTQLRVCHHFDPFAPV